MSRLFAIGDIHGCLTALETLVEEIGFEKTDRIVVLGDVVDRGPDAKGVIKLLMDLATRHEMIFLRGNHEIMMKAARGHRGERMRWLQVGGEAVLDSYGADTLDDIPQKHWDFISTFRPYFETRRHFFVHANVRPNRALDRQPDATLFWEPFGNPKPHKSGKVMVCGHTSQKSGDPLNVGHAICIDTFAHGGAWLSCLEVKSGQLWRANQKGKCRVDQIEDFQAA